MKHLIQGNNNEAWVEVEPSTLRLRPSYERRSEPTCYVSEKSNVKLLPFSRVYLIEAAGCDAADGDKPARRSARSKKTETAQNIGGKY